MNKHGKHGKNLFRSSGKKGKSQVVYMGNEWGDITIYSSDTNEYYEQLYANIFDNLEEMGKILERHKLPKLTQEEIYNTNSPISQFDENFSPSFPVLIPQASGRPGMVPSPLELW